LCREDQKNLDSHDEVFTLCEQLQKVLRECGYTVDFGILDGSGPGTDVDLLYSRARNREIAEVIGHALSDSKIKVRGISRDQTPSTRAQAMVTIKVGIERSE
jgi:hypothetical protein